MENSNFKKTVRLGTIASYGGRWMSIFCWIKLQDGRLSISGVEGPTPGGNCVGSCGQIDMHLRDHVADIRPAPGWNRDMLVRFFKVWRDHHLNDMHAGSPAQTAFLAANEISGYEAATKALSEAGLNPDPDYLHEGKPYVYGSAWLAVGIPQDALDFLRSLPDTDRPCAWSND